MIFYQKEILYGEIMHPDDLKRVEEELERSIQKGEVSFNSEYRIFTKAGDIRWVNERTFIRRDGKVTCFQGIVLDITPRKEIEEALMKSLEMERVLKTIINKSPAVAFIWKNIGKLACRICFRKCKSVRVHSGRFHIWKDTLWEYNTQRGHKSSSRKSRTFNKRRI